MGKFVRSYVFLFLQVILVRIASPEIWPLPNRLKLAKFDETSIISTGRVSEAIFHPDFELEFYNRKWKFQQIYVFPSLQGSLAQNTSLEIPAPENRQNLIEFH